VSNKIDITELPVEVIEKLVNDPVYYARIVHDSYLWSKQREIALALVKYKKVAVYSCTGSGKTFLVANLVSYMLNTRDSMIIPIVSPNFRSCLRTVWRNVVDMYYKSRIQLRGEITSTKWQITKGTHWAEVLSARKIEALQGLHSLYQFQVLEESSGIEDWVIDALDGNITGGINYRLMIGNPLRPEGEFYRTLFNPSYYKVRISVFDTPLFTNEINEIPEKYAKILRKVLPTPEYVEEVELKYGKDSAYYKAKILGIFPEESDMGMFNIADIEYAMTNKNVKENENEIYITADIASMGDDETVICVWKGFNCVEMVTSQKNDIMGAVGLINNIAKEYKVDINQHNSYIIVDATGEGRGVADRLLELGYTNVYPVNFSQNALEKEKYANIATEMFFHLRNVLRDRLIKLPYDDKLKRQLMSISYDFDSEGRFKLIPFKQLKKGKLGESPDRAVAVALRFCPVTMAVGII
jgi:hypothetical protein